MTLALGLSDADGRAASGRRGKPTAAAPGERSSRRTSLVLGRRDEVALSKLIESLRADGEIVGEQGAGEVLRRGLHALAQSRGIDVADDEREEGTAA